jgi:zinc transport system ATP-binding protein
MSRDVVFRARGLDLGYGANRVLNGVDLEVRAGEFWFAIGPNGSGKTTLLRALLGLLRPQGGALERDATLCARERIGFVPQGCELNPALPTTVREFVSLGFVGCRIEHRERPERLAWSLEHAGLVGLERRSYWALSGGQRQRALVARALVRQPQILILDEPTEGLDVASEKTLMRILVELHRAHGLTLIFVTHKLALAGSYASHAALFEAGRVIAGPREVVLRRPEVERLFGVAVDFPDPLRDEPDLGPDLQSVRASRGGEEPA